MLALVLAVCLLFWSQAAARGVPCAARDYGYGSVACVCNSSYCDTVEPTTAPQLVGGGVRHYVTSKAGQRLDVSTLQFSAVGQRTAAAGNVTSLKVNRKEQYQSVLGFGGALTDAAAINTHSLSAGAKEKLIRSYFSEEGIGYTFVRVPLGPTDFSTRYYQYADEGDVTLKHFNLTVEDSVYKIPFLKQAEKISSRRLKLFTTAWTAPHWMKNIDNTTGKSSLNKEYYQVYANYYVRFLEAYAAEGLEFWGLTPQNEPDMGLMLGRPVTMGWTEEQMLEYLVGHLCPSLRSSGLDKLKLMLVDDNRQYIPQWIKIFKNDSLAACVTGIATHWYSDQSTPATVLDDAHKEYPDKFMVYTEACPARVSGDQRVILGYWKDAADYVSDIIQVTKSWVGGWVDWNMVVDLQGGPNWMNETRDDAPVVVNSTSGEFYKQPTFYAMAHFAKFVPPGSVRVGLQVSSDAVEGVAFLTPDNVTAIVLHNKQDAAVEVVISDPARGSVSLDIPASSIHTLLYT